MLIRKPITLLATYGSFNSLSANSSISSTSSIGRRKSTRPEGSHVQSKKSYATIAENNEEQHSNATPELHPWPAAPKGHKHPTPYQILDMKDTATYSKARYYELVKIYHPDRSYTRFNGVPSTVRLERYRLIVAAHTILSDPAKRSAYDRLGAGWDGKADLAGRGQAGPFSRSWSDPNDPIWQNATWEDWERFYEWRQAKNGDAEGVRRSRQSPLYLRNHYFVLLVAVLALMGSTANNYRAHDAGAYFVEQRDIIHDRAAKELRRVKQDATQSGSRQDRVDWFVRNREATLGVSGVDTEAFRQEKAERLLPDREVCNSEEIVERRS